MEPKFLLYTTDGKKGASLSLFTKDPDGVGVSLFYHLDISAKKLKEIVSVLDLVPERGDGGLSHHVYYEPKPKPKTNG